MEDLVLVHGAPGDGSLWQPVIARMPGVRAVTPTLAGFGPDAPPDSGSRFGTAFHAEELVDLAMGSGAPVAIAVWSYSCHAVLEALLRRPELFTRCFLYEPGFSTYLDGEDLQAFGADAEQAFGPIFRALHEEGPEEAVRTLFSSSGGAGAFESLAPDRQARYLAGAGAMPLLLGGGAPPTNLQVDDLARVKVRTTVACGEHSRLLFQIASRAVARAVPGAALATVSNADHMLPEKDPERFAELLLGWLSGTEAQPAS